MAESNEQTVTIDGAKFLVKDLPDEAIKQIANLRFTDQEIERMTNHLAVLKTARTAYSRALAEALPKAAAKPEEAAKNGAKSSTKAKPASGKNNTSKAKAH